MKKIILLGLFSLLFFSLQAQQNDFISSNNQFMIRGFGDVGFNYYDKDGEENSSFTAGNFAPIFLFKQSDRLMFEAELELNLTGESLDIELEYADVIYVLNDYMTVRAGKFLVPFGTFIERLHPSWINRMPTKPLGFGHDGIAPGSGVGAELRGAFRVGTSSLTYSVYSTNGPRLKTPDGEEPEESGMLMFSNLKDNNNNRAYGTRIGWLPFSNSSMEIGYSYYTASSVGNKGGMYEDVGTNLYAFDFSYVKQIPGIVGTVDLKGQYTKSKIDNATYTVEEEPGEFEDLIFNNESKAYYGQVSYRPTMSGSDILKNIELVGRYSKLETPEDSGFATDKEDISVGLNYWLSWHSVIKLNYQNITGEGGHDVVGKINEKAFFINWAIGF
ncbi:MAG: hypothetical protein GZ087_07505 [Flavobacterium sp.]|nr:hypothetical protein [Flavobacterium sp.]